MSPCASHRDALHRLLDGEIDGSERALLEAHLEACPGCRAFAADLRSLRESLAALPPEPFPPEALDAVWARTVGARRGRPRSSPARWVIAAAAAVAIAILVPAILRRVEEGPYSEAFTAVEIDRAEQDAKLALALAAHAIRRGESAARDRVLAGHVAPAIRKLPFRRTPGESAHESEP